MNMDVVNSQQAQRWGFIGTVVWGLLIATVFVLSQLFAMMVYIGFQYGDVAEQDIGQLMLDLQYNGTVVAISTLASLLVCSLLIFGIIKLKKQSVIKHYLGWRMVDFAEFKYWFLLLIALLVLSDLLTWSIGKALVPPFMDTVYSTADPLWLLWVGIVVAAPLFEELFFRGF